MNDNFSKFDVVVYKLTNFLFEALPWLILFAFVFWLSYLGLNELIKRAAVESSQQEKFFIAAIIGGVFTIISIIINDIDEALKRSQKKSH
jgi:ABC-type arginine transport system permease subunit